uniref:Uncharacterized protein n=1 Tax=Anguilla anguilla TaxID=7936 RepID=A0A0E9WFW0_ANGAN
MVELRFSLFLRISKFFKNIFYALTFCLICLSYHTYFNITTGI